MYKYSSDGRSHSEMDIEQSTKENRKQGGADVNQTALVVMGTQRQREIREAIKNFLIEFITKALTFVISFLPSSFVLDQINAAQNASQAKHKLTSTLKQRMKNCKHPAHKNLEKTALIREIPTSHFELMVQDDMKDKKLLQNDVANASNSLNASLIERLLEIDAKAPTNTELKLLNYQEWVDMLLKINKVLLRSLCDLEAEFLSKVRDYSAKDIENNKLLKSYKADIIRLMEYISQAEIEGTWNLKDFIFETFERTDIFKMKSEQPKNDDVTSSKIVYNS